MSKDLKNIEPLPDLVMVMAEKSDPESWWLIDLTLKTGSLLSRDELKAIVLKAKLVFCPDAKDALTKLLIKPSPDLRWICLGTIKKLITKVWAPVTSPDFAHTQSRIEWAIKSAESALEVIKAAELGSLCALECQVIPATLAMEQAGLPFLSAQWRDELTRCDEARARHKANVEKWLCKPEGFALFGPEPVDLNNATAVKTGLEALLGVKLPGTSQSSLKHYDHEAVKSLLLYREQARMLSTYGETFLQKIREDRIYAVFEPLGSASGRFACHRPNLQALPKDETFQACIKAKAPYTLLSCDYGAFELRILAALSGDKQLLKIFNDKLDIHSMVAEAVFNCTVSKQENTHLRDQAKVLNFGIVYGMGEKALANQLSISLVQAEAMMKSYFSRFGQVKEFLLGLEKSALERGFVHTALGRRLHFAASEQDEKSIRRIARNMPIQGTGADIAKLALCRTWSRFYNEGLDARIVNMVHDELVIEAHEANISYITDIVKEEMHTAFNTVLPEIEADIGVSAYSSSQ